MEKRLINANMLHILMLRTVVLIQSEYLGPSLNFTVVS